MTFGVHVGVALYSISRYNGSLYSGAPLYNVNSTSGLGGVHEHTDIHTDRHTDRQRGYQYQLYRLLLQDVGYA